MGIPVYYVDPVPVVYGERTRDDEVRTEAMWSIQTAADCGKLIGKKLGIRRTNGEYVRGWLQDLPSTADELSLLRESNRSEEVRVPLEAIQMVEIVEHSFPPMQRIQTVSDYLEYRGSRVIIELATGERVLGVVQDLSDTCRHLVLRRESHGGETVPIPLATIGSIEALGLDPLLSQRKRLKAGQRPGKQPQLSKPAAVTKCVHGRDPVFCCDCRYLQ
jgi:hypothetical protein